MGNNVMTLPRFIRKRGTENASEPDQVVVHAVSLDVLAEQVRVAGNRVQQAKGLYDSEMENYRACQRALVERMKDVAMTNGVKLIQVAQDTGQKLED